jgi:hypothetical protein
MGDSNVLGSLVSSALQRNNLIKSYTFIVFRKSDAIFCTMNCFFNLQRRSSQCNVTIKKLQNTSSQLLNTRKQFNMGNLSFFNNKVSLSKRVRPCYNKEQISCFLLYLYYLSDPNIVKQGMVVSCTRNLISKKNIPSTEMRLK